MRFRAARTMLLATLAVLSSATATPVAAATARTPTSVSHAGAGAGDKSTPLLYVATRGCNCVIIYDQTTRNQVGQITGVSAPIGIATSRDGTLWVCTSNDVEAFPPGKSAPSLVLTIPERFAIDVAIRDDGTVYVAGQLAVYVFPRGATSPKTTIPTNSLLPRGLNGITLDSAGDIFVTGVMAGVDEGRIAEIAAGHATPVVLDPILAFPGGLAFDKSGDLLVADADDATTYVFRPGAREPYRHIGKVRTTNSSFLALDLSKTTLYVGNTLRAEVDVFDETTGRLEAILPAFGGYGSYVSVATSPRASF